MFSAYFKDVEKRLLRGAQEARKSGAKKTKGVKGKKGTDSLEELVQCVERIIPSRLRIGRLLPVDASGYSPEGVDFIAYQELYRDLGVFMDGVIPSQLVFGTYHVCESLTKDSLITALNRTIQTKKLDRFTDEQSEGNPIPSFIISYQSSLGLAEIKSMLLEFYMSKGIDGSFEFDIMMILNKGLVVKNWREKRSFVGLETGADTMMWFFILMNEYLEVERAGGFDLRSYVKHSEKYKEC